MDAKQRESDVAALRAQIRTVAETIAEELALAIMKSLCRSIAEELAKQLDLHSAIASEKSGTCQTCLWRGPKICQRQGSPFCNKRVTDHDSCGLYKFTRHPRGPLFAKYGDKKQARPRAVCDTCGCEFAVSKRGLYPHDVNGVAYVGGRGDKTRRCPGKPRTVGT